MNTKIISLSLHARLLSAYSTDVSIFNKIDIPNISWVEYPTHEFTATLSHIQSLLNKPTLDNVSTLITGFQQALKSSQLQNIGVCREQHLDILYSITGYYHLARIYLDALYQHIDLFAKSITFQDIEPIIIPLNNWYIKEIAKVTPEMTNEQIPIQLALCLVRKANLFARCLSNMFSEEMKSYPLLTKPLPDNILEN